MSPPGRSARRPISRWLPALVLAIGGGCPLLVPAQEPAPEPEPVAGTGIENIFRMAPDLYSGGQPPADAGFAALRRLGVRTVISVDGPRPDLDAAHRAGLRYVHVPVGYDGITAEQAARLVTAVKDQPGAVYVHCHHGKHRGPAAAAISAMATRGWSSQDALRWLKQAGTSPDYPGLFASVGRFTPPTAAELAAVGPDDLPEAAPVPDLVSAMSRIDALWDDLQAIQRAGFAPPPGHPDLEPAVQATRLAEALAEAARLPESVDRGAEFPAALRQARALVTELADGLKQRGSAEAVADRAGGMARVADGCKSCHARFRDHAGP